MRDLYYSLEHSNLDGATGSCFLLRGLAAPVLHFSAVKTLQTLLDDHIAGGKHTAAAVVSEPELQRAMFFVGYFSPNPPLVE